MNEEVLQHTHTHTHTTVSHIYTWRDNREYFSVNIRKRYRSLVACDAKNPDGHLSYLIISFFLFSRFFLLSPVPKKKKKKKNRRSSAPGGYQGDDKESWEDGGDTKSVCLERTWRICSSEESVEANSDRLSSPVQHVNGQQTPTIIRKDTRNIHIEFFPNNTGTSSHTAFPANLDIFVCVTTTVLVGGGGGGSLLTVGARLAHYFSAAVVVSSLLAGPSSPL